MDPQDIGKKTSFTMFNEDGTKNTITLEKHVADALHTIGNVHGFIQETYNKVSLLKPHLTRMQKGDVVRDLALVKAKETPAYKKYMNDLRNSL
jgi:hypothetical protein